MKKLMSLIVSAMLLLSLLPAAAFAETNVNLNAQSGRLLISEAGTYTLTGSMRGTVWVDPGQGDVTLIMDNMRIDGAEGAGIAAVSGDSLTVILANGTVNQVQDGGHDPMYDAAIFCAVPARFEGSGRLDVTGNNSLGIRGQNADLTFASGSYFIQGTMGSVETDARLSVLNAQVMDMNSNQLLAATPQMVVQTGNNGKLNLRQEADKSSTMIEQYANGTQVTVLENQGEWSQVQVNGQTGYMMNQYLAPVQGQTVESIASTAQNAPSASAAMQPAFNSSDTTGSMTPPQLPEQQGQASNQKGNNPPSMPSEMNGQNQGQMPGRMDGQQQNDMGGGQMPGGMMAGSNVLTSTADSPTEIVTSTAVNAAADLEADMENAEYITMTDDNNLVKISDSGTYVVTGSSSDGNITVKKGSTGVVLVLDDLDLTSTTGATVAVNKEAQVKIIISGNVTLTDNENPDDENSTDEAIADAFDGAAMKFKANSQVYLTGDGTLTINGNAKNGIKTGDDSSLIVDGGVTVNIKAVNDGINGNYDVTLLGGNFTIEAGDDAIHADHILTLGREDGTGPNVRVTGSNEGLEGTVVNVFGGDITIHSTDDAINAANGDGLYEGELTYAFNMTGGRVSINSQGDGIDSNGNVNLLGGTIAISSASMGGEAGIDFDGQYYVAADFSLNNQSGVAGPDGMPGGTMNAQMGGTPGEMNTQMGTAPDLMNNGQNSFGQQSNEQAAAFNGNQAAFTQNQPFAAQAGNNNQMPFAQGPFGGNTAQNGFAANQNGNMSFGQQPPQLPQTNE